MLEGRGTRAGAAPFLRVGLNATRGDAVVCGPSTYSQSVGPSVVFKEVDLRQQARARPNRLRQLGPLVAVGLLIE